VLFTGGGLAAAFTSGLVLTRPHVSDLAGSALLLAALVGTVVVAVGYRLAPSVVGQVGTAVGVVCTVSGALELAHSVDSDPWFGLAVLSLGVGWLLLVERGVWRERQAGQLVAGALALVGAQYSVFGDHALLAYVATGLLALAAFAGYVARSSWPYLATGVLAATLVVPEALTDWTEGSVGSAGGLLAAGVTLLAASLLGLSLRRGAAEH
jgi:hypothetical protein